MLRVMLPLPLLLLRARLCRAPVAVADELTRHSGQVVAVAQLTPLAVGRAREPDDARAAAALVEHRAHRGDGVSPGQVRLRPPRR